ncbi:hypothetical protein AGMMS4957_05760 [Bacteroidia bacterium]|nr:hypothetical protein AGMMS4957_05760 [Bacteroidia bacterium]
MKTKKLFVFMAACMLLVGCEKEVEPTMSVSTNLVTVGKDVYSSLLVIRCNLATDWTATVDATWCSIERGNKPPKEDGDEVYWKYELYVTVEANPTITERTATITIQAGALQEKVTVTQKAGDATLSTTPALIYPETNAAAGTYPINVTSNAEWTTEVEYIYDPSWGEYQDKTWCVLEPSSGSGSGVITVNLPQNSTHFRRWATITISSGNLVQTATIGQHGVPAFENEGVTINGITWATKNVEGSGTFAYSSQDPGKYYQFNRIWGYSYIAGKIEPEFNADVYRNGDWFLINDPSPEGWRLPTSEEMENLRTSGYRWVSDIKGAWFGPDAQTATFGEPGNAVFLSANGALWNGDMSTEQGEGQYWTKSTPSGISQALRFGAWGSKKVNDPYDGINKICGLSIRCVKE